MILMLLPCLHTLFDLGLIGVDAVTMKIIISPKLYGSEYALYEGKNLHIPDDINCAPDKCALNLHRLKHGL